MAITQIDRRLGRHTFAAVTITAAVVLWLATAGIPHRAGFNAGGVVLAASPAQQAPMPPRPYGRRGVPSEQPATNRIYTGVPGSISGSIEDQLGDLVPGVVVRLANGTGEVRTTRASSNATFEFTGLPPGSYSLDLIESGFAPTRVDVALAEGESLTRAVVLPIGVVEESIQVMPVELQAASAPVTELDRLLASRLAAVAPARAASACARSGPCVTPALKIVDRQPQYPPEAVSLGTEGMVILEARITPEGIVEQIQPVLSADDSLKESVLAAIRQWQYKPTLLNGVPVETKLTVSVEFSRTPDR